MFDTSNLVIVFYPPFAGGKFLINSLGISNGAVLQDGPLAEQDLAGLLTSQDKLNILQSRIATETNPWRDLDLACRYLFGVDEFNFFAEDLETASSKITAIGREVLYSNKMSFMVSHYPRKYRRLKEIFKNAKTISFTNSSSFLANRNEEFYVQTYWNNIKGDNWPSTAPLTYAEFNQCPKDIQKEIISKFPDLCDEFIDAVESETCDVDTTYYWDNNLYFSADKTADNVEQLYQWLGLTDFNRKHIVDYFNCWNNKLAELKQL